VVCNVRFEHVWGIHWKLLIEFNSGSFVWNLSLLRSWNCVFGIVIQLLAQRPRKLGSVPAGQRILLFSKRSRLAPEPTASYLIGTCGYFPGCKVVGARRWPSTSVWYHRKSEQSYTSPPLPPICHHGVHRGKFIFRTFGLHVNRDSAVGIATR
jgi:hypothetical protein